MKLSEETITVHHLHHDEIYRIYFFYQSLKIKKKVVNVRIIFKLVMSNEWED